MYTPPAQYFPPSGLPSTSVGSGAWAIGPQPNPSVPAARANLIRRSYFVAGIAVLLAAAVAWALA